MVVEAQSVGGCSEGDSLLIVVKVPHRPESLPCNIEIMYSPLIFEI